MYKTKLVIGLGDGALNEEGLMVQGWDWSTVLPLDSIDFKNNRAFNIIAHDVFEHIGKQTGSVEDELRAFGALLFGRFNMGITETDIDLGTEIGSFLTPYIKQVKHPKIHTDVLNYSDGLCEGIREELKYTYPECDFQTLKNQVLHWISKGYRQAERKYKYPCTLVNMYTELQRQLTEKLRFVELIKHVMISYDPATEYVDVRVVEEPFEE
jgi:hypothetical protein